MVFELEEGERGDGGVDDARRGVLATWLTAPSCTADAETGREERGGSVEMKGARRPGLWEDSGGESAYCIVADICGTGIIDPGEPGDDTMRRPSFTEGPGNGGRLDVSSGSNAG